VKNVSKVPYKSGDVVDIPLPSGKLVRGWIIYASSYFKDAIGLLTYAAKSRDAAELPHLEPMGQTIYTSALAAAHHGWKVVGYCDVDENTMKRTTRIVGGQVFMGDNCVRQAAPADQHELPKMLAKGMIVVHRELEEMYSHRTSAAEAE
jgi:hypothetical protein